MSVVYQILKLIVKVSLRLFYSKTTFENRKRGFFKNPCIVVSNHPSTVMDPLNGVAWIGPSVKFLANASLFKTPFTRWFFNTFYCIKVERYKDTQGKPLDNALAFERARHHLEKGKPLFLAPEGGSLPNRELRKLKTGFARIALDAESSNDFNLGLTILPIGLNYEFPTQFRSELYTKFGEHIPVADFKEDYKKDPVLGVRKLTDFLSAQLKTLLIHTENKEEEYLQRKLEIIMQNESFLPPKENLERNQNMLAYLRSWEENDKVGFERFKEQVDGYFERLLPSKTKLKKNSIPFFGKLKLSDASLVKEPDIFDPLFKVIFLLFTFPFFLIGFLSNCLPLFSIGQINKKFNHDPSFDSTFKYVSGLVLVPLFYWLQSELIERIFHIDGLFIFYILVFLMTGLFAEKYMKVLKMLYECIRLRKRGDLKQERKGILKLLIF